MTGAARVDGSPGANNPCSQDSWLCVDDDDDDDVDDGDDVVVDDDDDADDDDDDDDDEDEDEDEDNDFSCEATRDWQSKDLSCTLQPQARVGRVRETNGETSQPVLEFWTHL